MTKRFGFTLAEVLITLGIIGVVAAMTIPTLIANTNSAKFRSQFKKTLSTLNQAGLMAQAQYDFDYAGTDVACLTGDTGDTGETGDNPEDRMSFCSLLNGTLTGATYVADLSTLIRTNSGQGGSSAYSINKPDGFGSTIDDIADYHGYQLADGSIVAFPSDAMGCTVELGHVVNSATLAEMTQCIGFIDVNGTTLPNREVNCGDSATSGTASRNVQSPCTVKNDAKHMTDIFPVVFHDATVEPASDAAKYVLTSSK